MGKMAEVQRKLLEQMMGPEAMGIQPVNVDWWSEKVCRNYLFGHCPHLIFGNTKMDLGPCPRIHSDRILKQFQEHQAAQPNDPRILAFKQEHENNLYGFVEDCDRRIRASQRKLEKTPEENRKTVDLMKEIGEIELSIQGGTEEIEALGEAGKVEESMEKLAAVDALKQLKVDKEKDLQNLNETAGASGHQKLRVCETCGAMLSVLDSDKRLADHFGGKLHLGYHELRNLLAAMAEERMTGRSNPNPSLNSAAPPSGGVNSIPPGPRGPANANPPSFAPSGPSHSSNGPPPPSFAPASGPGGGYAPRRESLSVAGNGNGIEVPRTPSHSKVPPAEEMPVVGHGDKHKREAGELIEDIKAERGESRDRNRDSDSHRDRDRYRDRERDDKDRYREKERDRDDRDRYRDRDRGDEKDRDGSGSGSRHKYRDRDEEGERYDKYESRGSSRYDDRDRRDGHRSSDRDRERKYEYDYEDDRKRSKSPSRRRVL